MDSRGEREGVIKYRLDFSPGAAPGGSEVLDAWRTVLHRLGMVGQCSERYGGYGFGNVSVRSGGHFLISGTQTGAPERLGPDGYAQVTEADAMANKLRARGPVKPSSEALTHATVYGLHHEIGAVFHAHSPEIWHATAALSLPHTGARVPYGTPQMAQAVRSVWQDKIGQPRGVLTMLGHEDGVIAFGRDCGEAGALLVQTLAAALGREGA